jgi:DNA adenine methylase
MALIRYPGSKAKIAKQIMALFTGAVRRKLDTRRPSDEDGTTVDTLWHDGQDIEYREPFFGAGAVGFRMLTRLSPECHVWLNDIDYGLVCLWKAVKEAPDELHRMIDGFTPSVDTYEEYKASDGERGRDFLLVGFRKLALHQMSYSGLGVKSGGPLGGKTQGRSEYRVDCRWNRCTLKRDVWILHDVLVRSHQSQVTCRDFAEVFQAPGRNVFLYCDPPYYDKGPELYKHSMGPEDHKRLAKCCRETRHSWCVSYDDHEEVRRLYDGFPIRNVSAVYTVATVKGAPRRKNSEIVITDNHRKDEA